MNVNLNYNISQGLNKWVEVGNSGVFRPEMLLPMNLPKDVTVLAWGLSLERFVNYLLLKNTTFMYFIFFKCLIRPMMIKYGINNIRDLIGHKVNLQTVYDSPICRIKS